MTDCYISNSEHGPVDVVKFLKIMSKMSTVEVNVHNETSCWAID